MPNKLTCRAYVHTLGWQPYVEESEVCGTTGKGLYIEALQFQYDGEDVFEYNIRNQEIGWMGTYSLGEIAGTLEKNSPLNGLKCSFLSGSKHIYYEGHFSYEGWIKPVQDGELLQPQNNKHWLEAIRFYTEENQSVVLLVG